MGENGCPVILPTWRLYSLLHAANLRHGADGFTSPLKEGVMRIFSPVYLCIVLGLKKPWRYTNTIRLYGVWFS